MARGELGEHLRLLVGTEQVVNSVWAGLFVGDLASDAVGNRSLHAVEEKETAEQGRADRGRRGNEERARRLTVARESPAEAVNHARHRIESVEPTPAPWNQRAWIGDRRGKHPELDEEGRDVLDVAIQCVESGEP